MNPQQPLSPQPLPSQPSPQQPVTGQPYYPAQPQPQVRPPQATQQLAPQPIQQPAQQSYQPQQSQFTQQAYPLAAPNRPAYANPQANYQNVAYTRNNTPTPQPQAQPSPVKTPDNPNSTQSTLLLSEIRDSLVIMKDGSFRAVIACKSINFDLMSETEREGVEYSYQSFLNSLNFTTQILIRSQRVDIGPYLERLTEIRKNNDNMLLGVLMDDYINFVDILSQEANIMDKSFFIIIPYYTSSEAEKALTQTKNIFDGLFGKNKTPQVTRIDRTTYDKAISEINNRVEAIISGLFQIGIHSVRLNTRELSELYYNFNNPDTAVREPFIDFNKMATTYVKKGDSQNVQNA